ncbi:MAG: hypothetical protein Q4F67_06835, partial [Propionibacteriaceae bacterium]|nr:hypothetical protein [Propionibacteriaceae bacterium]
MADRSGWDETMWSDEWDFEEPERWGPGGAPCADEHGWDSEPAPPRPEEAPLLVAGAVRSIIDFGACSWTEWERAHHRDRRWKVAIAVALEELLVRTITELWNGGWQPGDLHRLARKKSVATGRVVRDAMLAELAGYPRATVDQRYWDHLADLEAERWWPDG